MWNMIPMVGSGGRKRGMNTMTAMVVGASVGIAAWEMVRRRNGGGTGEGIGTGQLPNLAKTVMNAIAM